MKHGKKPTLEQKVLITAKGMEPADWFVVKNLDDRLELISKKEPGKIRVISKSCREEIGNDQE